MLKLLHFFLKKCNFMIEQIVKKMVTDGIKISILLYLVLDPNFFQLQ